MKKTFIIIIFLLSGLHAFAQFEFALSFGYGSYAMNSMKFFQEKAGQNNSLPLQITTSFPPYWNYNLRIGATIDENSSLGNIFSFMSTGARSSIADYSGFVYSDMNLNALREGIYYKRDFLDSEIANKPFRLGFMVDLSLVYTNATFTDSLKIYDTSIGDYFRMNLKSFGIYTEPLLIASYEFIPRLKFELSGGGAINYNLPLFFEKISNKMVYENKKIRPNWSGFRISAGISYRL